MRNSEDTRLTIPGLNESTRRPKALSRAAALGVGALAAAAMLAGTAAPASGWNQSSAEATLWQLMNGDRANNGRQLVQQQGTLVGLARWRSRDMVQRNYFDHTVAGTGYQVYHWYDANGLQYVWGGENIGWNSGYSDGDSPVAINQGFMNSPSHRANILQPSWTHAGVGAFAADNVSFLGATRSPRMYTQLFMQARNVAPPPPPAPPAPPVPPAPAPRPVPPPPPPPARVAAPAAPAVAPAVAAAAPAGAPRSATVRKPAARVAAKPVSAARPFRLVLDPMHDRRVAPFDTAPFDTMAAADPRVASSYRLDAPVPAERGVIDTLLGALLGFVLG